MSLQFVPFPLRWASLLKKLDGALVLCRLLSRVEGAEVAPSAGSRVQLP